MEFYTVFLFPSLITLCKTSTTSNIPPITMLTFVLAYYENNNFESDGVTYILKIVDSLETAQLHNIEP